MDKKYMEKEKVSNSLRATLKKVPNLKTPRHDGIHGYWFKKFTSIHDRIAIKMNRLLLEIGITEWLTKGKTTLIQKGGEQEIYYTWCLQ